MKKLQETMKKVVLFALTVVMVVLVCGTLWQVITRFILGDPNMYTEEVSRYALIWATMLGAAYGFLQDTHMALVIVKNKLEGKVGGSILYVFCEACVMAFVIMVMVLGGYKLCIKNVNQVSAVLRISMSIIYSIIPISGFLIIIGKLAHYIDLVQTKMKGAQ